MHFWTNCSSINHISQVTGFQRSKTGCATMRNWNANNFYFEKKGFVMKFYEKKVNRDSSYFQICLVLHFYSYFLLKLHRCSFYQSLLRYRLTSPYKTTKIIVGQDTIGMVWQPNLNTFLILWHLLAVVILYAVYIATVLLISTQGHYVKKQAVLLSSSLTIEWFDVRFRKRL